MTATIKLTVKQQQWFDHIQTAQAKGIAFSVYAKQHSLSSGALYNAHSMLREKGVLKNTENKKPRNPFVQAKRTAIPSSNSENTSVITIMIANGACITLPADVTVVAAITQAVFDA